MQNNSTSTREKELNDLVEIWRSNDDKSPLGVW